MKALCKGIIIFLLNFPVLLYGNQGKEIEFEFQGSVYKARKNDLQQGQGIILLIYDITQEKELEKKERRF